MNHVCKHSQVYPEYIVWYSKRPTQAALDGQLCEAAMKGDVSAMERLAAADPERFELMHPLGGALEEAGVLELEKVEVQPRLSRTVKNHVQKKRES